MSEEKLGHTHKIVEKGEDVHLLFYVNGMQVGASVFPYSDRHDFDEYFLALELGRVWDGLSK